MAKKKRKIKKQGFPKNQKIILSLIIGIVLVCLLGIILTGNKEWVQRGNVVKKGNQSFKIGEYYDYDETNSGQIQGLIDVKWKVLGVSDGNLLIMSSSNIGTLTLGNGKDLEISENDYIEGISKLNDLASSYGKGKNAISARSITLDDINKVTGYDKLNKNDSIINQDTTYYWGSEENPIYKDSKNEEGVLSLKHNNMFVWYDVNTNKWNTSNKLENVEKEKITTLRHTFYSYENKDFNTNEELLSEESLEYKMLYIDDDGNRANYFTADRFIYLRSSFVGYGYNIVKFDSINYTYLVYSSGNTRETSAGVRAIITID